MGGSSTASSLPLSSSDFPTPIYSGWNTEDSQTKGFQTQTNTTNGYFGRGSQSDFSDDIGSCLCDPGFATKFLGPYTNGVRLSTGKTADGAGDFEVSSISANCEEGRLRSVTVVCPNEDDTQPGVQITLEGPFGVKGSFLKTEQINVRNSEITGYVNGQKTSVRGADVQANDLLGRLKLFRHKVMGW